MVSTQLCIGASLASLVALFVMNQKCQQMEENTDGSVTSTQLAQYKKMKMGIAIVSVLLILCTLYSATKSKSSSVRRRQRVPVSSCILDAPGGFGASCMLDNQRAKVRQEIGRVADNLRAELSSNPYTY